MFIAALVACITLEMTTNTDNVNSEGTISEVKENWWNKSSLDVIREIKSCEKPCQVIGIVTVYYGKLIARIILIISGFAAVAMYIPY